MAQAALAVLVVVVDQLHFLVLAVVELAAMLAMVVLGNLLVELVVLLRAVMVLLAVVLAYLDKEQAELMVL
jgi:hypothetical protein